MNISLCTLILIVLFYCESVFTYDSLQQVHVIFRHGDKTPEKVGVYPKDPYRNESYWYPYGFGSLTNKGKVQAYNVGRSLRKRYNEFLGKVYLPEIISARSTDFARTKMSLQLVLAGLWPPTPIQLWNVQLQWQPIPFEYEPMERDKLMKFPLSYCKVYQEEYKKAQNAEDIQKFLKENSHIIDYINKHSGLNCSSTLDLVVLYYVLLAEEQYNLNLPEWTKKVYPDFLAKATSLEYKIQTSSDEMISMGGGHFIQKIIQDAKTMMNYRLRSKTKKIFLYSGHEYNIVQVLASLRLFQGQIPTYASYVLIELHKINHVYGFKIYYQDHSQDEPKQLQIPGCAEFCDFQQFYNLIFTILPHDNTC